MDIIGRSFSSILGFVFKNLIYMKTLLKEGKRKKKNVELYMIYTNLGIGSFTPQDDGQKQLFPILIFLSILNKI